jgi:hypothetical protein
MHKFDSPGNRTQRVLQALINAMFAVKDLGATLLV